MNKYKTYGRAEDAQGEEQEGTGSTFGVNQRVEAPKLPAGLCAEASNCRMREGTPETRPGSTRPGWMNVTRASVDAVVKGVDGFYGAGSFKDPNGTEWILTAADGGIFRHKPHNGRMAVPVPMSVRVLSDCSFCQAFNVVYCFRGKYLQPLVMSNVDTGFADLVQRWNSTGTFKAAVLATGQVAEEVAYGPFATITSLTSVGDLATVVTAAEHGYVTGADVVVKGANEAGYNGRWNITVVDANTFRFQFPGAASPATGTPKVSNMGLYWRALGSRIALAAGELTSAATTATVHHVAHGFTSGQYVTISGATQAEYNGTFLMTVTDADHFTYAFAGSGTTPATGTIFARTSIVLAGQSPETNAEAWQQIYNVLPNCAEGIFVNNQVLASTAYTPGKTSYDSTSTYTKTDFVVALDIGDLVHFNFVNEFRINQGGDDEIVQLLKAPSGAVNAAGLSTDAVVVLKGKSWGVLTGVSGDLSQVALDMHPQEGLGSCAARGGVVAGRNVLFPVSSRGICGLVQFLDGQARSVNVPFSNDVPGWVGRIAWTLAGKMRAAYWDDRLYVAAPLDRGVCQVGGAMASQNTANAVGGKVAEMPLEVGTVYEFVPGNITTLCTATGIDGGVVPAGTTIGPGIFTATQPTYYIFFPAQVHVTGEVHEVRVGVNNGVLVFDFRVPHINTLEDGASPYVYETGSWVSLDTGRPWCVKEWVKGTYNGRERLFFIGEDGWANLVEESDAGDQVEDASSLSGLGTAEIVLDWTSRGYRLGSNGQKKWKWLELVLGVWHAVFDVWKGTGAAGMNLQDGMTKLEAANVMAGKSFSRTKYLKPAGKADYVLGNGNGDFLSAGRGDYSMDLGTGLTVPSDGIAGVVFQEVVLRQSVRTLAGRYGQFRVRATRGRVKIKGVTPTASEGMRRGGIIV